MVKRFELIGCRIVGTSKYKLSLTGDHKSARAVYSIIKKYSLW